MKCPICNKIIYLDKIAPTTICGHNWESIHHSCYKCNKDLVVVTKSDRIYMGSFSPNDHYYGYENIEIKVFDCIAKDYISCKGYKIDTGGLYAVRE